MEENKTNFSADMLRELANSNLNSDTQNKLINEIVDNATRGEDISVLDRLIGKKERPSILALLLSLLIVIIVSIVSFIFRSEMDFVTHLWTITLPGLTSLWGYAFGKSQS